MTTLLLLLLAAPPQPHTFCDDPVGIYAGAEDPPEVAEDEDGPAEAAEAESQGAAAASSDGRLHYSADLSDAQLLRRWNQDLASLGTISVGFADQGRLINAVHMGSDEAWVLQRPELAWGTQETVTFLSSAFRAVHQKYPGSAPARLSHIGLQEGGYLRPHRSHQSGRDADIGFFYKNDQPPGARARREKLIDLPRNWTLIKALITQSDVQFILVDRGIQKVLRDYALSAGEDRDWVNGLFSGGSHALIQHARHHKDHFHVRFYSPRSQELGRRIQPLLALRPEQNIVFHKVKRGETLGQIARVMKTSVALIMKANRMHKTFLHLGQQLKVPLRGACTRCPLPPAVVVPPRRLPAVEFAKG